MDHELSEIKVYKTTDYSIFKRLEGNREVTNQRRDAIIDSIREIGYQPIPILVNEKMEIVDGQGRVDACEKLNLPVYYTIKKGVGYKECITMNIQAVIWTVYDYIASYTEKGYPDYVKLQEYKEMAGNLDIIEVAMCMSNALSKNVNRPLKNGTFEIVEENDNKECLNFISRVKPYLKSLKGGGNYYIPVLIGIFKLKLADSDRMEDSISKYSSSMSSAYNADDALTGLQEVFNYNRRVKQYFRDRYLETMESKGARYKN